MTSTVVNSKIEMVGEESLTYMRPIDIRFDITDCKPNSRMYATFDGVDVNQIITPLTGVDSNVLGGRIFVDSDGKVSGILSIPGKKFSTGARTLRLTENPNYMDLNDVPGSTYGVALATFTSSGLKQIYQETVTSTVTTDRVVVDTTIVEKQVSVPVYVRQPRPFVFSIREQGGQGGRDPLAQSFFTYGYDGGCFVTSIDIYFYSKDESLPVILELREMVNGYPGPELVSDNARVSLLPSLVNLSEDSSVATNFKFSQPVYLEEDKEYCFVLLSNSQNYNAFTCTMGELSIETGKKVFEQPLLGSLFKSQNNSTWTAEQYEDVKFKMYRAKFDTSVEASVNLSTSAPATAIDISFLETFNGSNTIRAVLPYDHNLDTGNRVSLAVDSKGTYNGIPAVSMTGTFIVSSILSERVIEFPVLASATASGKIETGGFVSYIYVDDGGSGYDSLSAPSIVLSAPSSGTTATAVPVIKDGKITQIKVVNPGSKYTVAPSVTITGGLGSGASATASIDTKATLATNHAYSMVNPAIPNYIPSGTGLSATYTFTKGNYPGGNITSYTESDPIDFNIADRNWIQNNGWLCSYANEQAMMSGRKSATVNLKLSSSRDNLSPMILASDGYAIFSGYHINNQDNEDINSVLSYGSVDSIQLIDGGSGYSSTPSIALVNQFGCTGTGATANAIMAAGTISEIVLGNPGFGYTKPPIVYINGASTTPASAESILTPFNTETASNNGQARSKYITKVNTLETPSDSARVFVTAYSSHKSSFDVYLRMTLKANGTNHTEQPWVLMQCDVDRNKSTKDEEYLEYEFYLDDLQKFDTYDLKIVLKSNNPIDVPWIKDYRAIMTA